MHDRYAEAFPLKSHHLPAVLAAEAQQLVKLSPQLRVVDAAPEQVVQVALGGLLADVTQRAAGLLGGSQDVLIAGASC